MAGHYAVMGARVRGDGDRYLSAAASLLAGRELSAKQLLFLPYELFLAGLHWLGGGPVSAVAANCLFTLGATLLLWWMLKRGGEPLAGLVGALALLVTVEIQ
ncbi:MAG: hypothetical protein KKA81_17405, partial [Bacteroidetes bacterium]|nr:hypothetical protein [Bacteroidota bacterium]